MPVRVPAPSSPRRRQPFDEFPTTGSPPPVARAMIRAPQPVGSRRDGPAVGPSPPSGRRTRTTTSSGCIPAWLHRCIAEIPSNGLSRFVRKRVRPNRRRAAGRLPDGLHPRTLVDRHGLIVAGDRDMDGGGQDRPLRLERGVQRLHGRRRGRRYGSSCARRRTRRAPRRRRVRSNPWRGGLAAARRTAHVLVTSEQAHFCELVTPGGFESCHIDASDAAPSATLPPAGPPDAPRLVAASEPHGAEIIGPSMGRD